MGQQGCGQPLRRFSSQHGLFSGIVLHLGIRSSRLDLFLPLGNECAGQRVRLMCALLLFTLNKPCASLNIYTSTYLSSLSCLVSMFKSNGDGGVRWQQVWIDWKLSAQTCTLVAMGIGRFTALVEVGA